MMSGAVAAAALAFLSVSLVAVRYIVCSGLALGKGIRGGVTPGAGSRGLSEEATRLLDPGDEAWSSALCMDSDGFSTGVGPPFPSTDAERSPGRHANGVSIQMPAARRSALGRSRVPAVPCSTVSSL